MYVCDGWVLFLRRLHLRSYYFFLISRDPETWRSTDPWCFFHWRRSNAEWATQNMMDESSLCIGWSTSHRTRLFGSCYKWEARTNAPMKSHGSGDGRLRHSSHRSKSRVGGMDDKYMDRKPVYIVYMHLFDGSGSGLFVWWCIYVNDKLSYVIYEWLCHVLEEKWVGCSISNADFLSEVLLLSCIRSHHSSSTWESLS